MVDIPTIETERLRLRPYTRADFPAYAEMWTDPAVYRYIGGQPIPREQAWTMFLRQAGLWHHMGFGFWAIELKSSGELIGECGFQERLRNMAPPIEGTIEAGWALRGTAQGQGIATEAMGAALDWADRHATPAMFTAIIDIENAPSARLARRLGFTERGPGTYNDKPLTIFERPRRG